MGYTRGSLQGSTPLVPLEFGIRYKGSPLATWVISMSMSAQVGKFVGGLKCCPHVRCKCLQCGSWRRHPRLKQVCVTPTLPLSPLSSSIPSPHTQTGCLCAQRELGPPLESCKLSWGTGLPCTTSFCLGNHTNIPAPSTAKADAFSPPEFPIR